jgi:non-specific serine/threonine protein kinase
VSRSPALTPGQFTTFGELLKFLRRRAGLSQRELSIAVGYSHSQISRLEQNQRPPDVAAVAARFVSALDLETERAWAARLLELAASRAAGEPEQPERPAGPALHNLPIQLTSFVGREKEMAEIKRLLTPNQPMDVARLLTLTGPGGTGKTRLALQVAAALLDSFPDGVWLIDLAPLADSELVPQTVARVLGVREEVGRPLLETLADHLRAQQALLVLDNCEHLIQTSAQFAEAMLQSCAKLRILATSREFLGVAGEQVFYVPSLSTPDPGALPHLDTLISYEAVRLFVERAASNVPDFDLTGENAPAVAQVCQRLDGIPLAIELASARLRMLPVEQIAERLDDRFRLLTGGSRTALPRHQTLQALIDWSYGLLAEAERLLLNRLAVFAGGWTLAAAEAVGAGEGITAEAVFELLAHLVDKSLVLAEEQHGAARYRMLETIRQYALAKLLDSNETNAVRDRHLSFCLRLAEDAEPHLSGPAQATWFARLEQDYANFHTALDWSLQEPDASHGMRLATALDTLWYLRGPFSEGLDWLVRAVSRPEAVAPSRVRARALLAIARLLWNTAEFVRSNRYIEESLAISRALEYRSGVARALYLLGMNARVLGDFKTSISALEQSLASREELDSESICGIYLGLGLIAAVEGDYDAAGAYLGQAMTVAQAAESSYNVALTFGHLGILAFLQRDYDDAEAKWEQSLSAGRAFGYKGLVIMTARGLAYVALQRGQVERAAALCRESLLLSRERRTPMGLAAGLAAFAALAAACGQPERSAKLYGSAAARLVGYPGGRHRWPQDPVVQERYLNILRAQLDEATFNAAWEAGYALTLDQAIAVALEETHG